MKWTMFPSSFAHSLAYQIKQIFHPIRREKTYETSVCFPVWIIFVQNGKIEMNVFYYFPYNFHAISFYFSTFYTYTDVTIEKK